MTTRNSTSYKDKFPNLDVRLVEAVRKMILVRRIYRQEEEVKIQIMEETLREICQILDVSLPELIINAGVNHTGMYKPSTQQIVLPKCSIVTFLHELRHHIQNVTKQNLGDEEDARGWSISLFYQASPKHYENAVKKNLLFFR